MRRMLIIAVLLLLSSGLPAQPEPEQGGNQNEQPAPQQTKPMGVTAKPTSEPVKRFTPSEKVGADSAVSFPVDI